MAKLNRKRRNSSTEQRLYLAVSRSTEMKESARLKQGTGWKSKWQQKKKDIVVDKKPADGILNRLKYDFYRRHSPRAHSFGNLE